MWHPGHNARRRRRSGGFTVLEGLLAGVVLAISATAIGFGMSQSLQSLQLARDYQQAAALLDEILTRIDIVGPSAVQLDGPLSGEFPEPYERFTWEASVVSGASLDLYEVTVTITWPGSGGGVRAASATTLLNDPLRSRPIMRWEDLDR